MCVIHFGHLLKLLLHSRIRQVALLLLLWLRARLETVGETASVGRALRTEQLLLTLQHARHAQTGRLLTQIRLRGLNALIDHLGHVRACLRVAAEAG